MAKNSSTPFNFGIDQEGPYFRSGTWALSLLTATSAYINLKSTAIYKHYSLSDFDRSPVLLVSIFIVHVALYSLSYSTRGNYLLDLRRKGNPYRAANAVAWVLEVLALSFYFQNQELMEESPSMVFVTTFALFLQCFMSAVVPGFSIKLPMIAMGVAIAIAIRIGRVWALMPYTAVVLPSIFLLQGFDVVCDVTPCAGDVENKKQSGKEMVV